MGSVAIYIYIGKGKITNYINAENIVEKKNIKEVPYSVWGDSTTGREIPLNIYCGGNPILLMRAFSFQDLRSYHHGVAARQGYVLPPGNILYKHPNAVSEAGKNNN